MNLNRFWPWKQFAVRDAEILRLQRELKLLRNIHKSKKDEMETVIHTKDESLGRAQLELQAANEKLTEKDNHIRRLGVILAMVKGIEVSLFLMLAVTVNAQPTERNLFTTNPPPSVGSVSGPFVTTNPLPLLSYNAGGFTNLQSTNLVGVVPETNLPLETLLWTNDGTQKIFGTTTDLPPGTKFEFNNVANGGNIVSNVSYTFQGSTIGKMFGQQGSVDFVNMSYNYTGTNKIPAACVMTILPISGGQVSEFATFAGFCFNKTTNKVSGASGWLYGNRGVYGFECESVADVVGGGQGQNIGVCGYSTGSQLDSVGTVGVSFAGANNQTNIGASGSAEMQTFSGGAYIGGYFEVQNNGGSAPTDPSNLVSSVIYGDNRNSGVPLLSLFSNATQVAQVDANGNAVFAQRVAATNGIASYATNIVISISSSGFTNDVAHGLGTNNMIVDIIAVGETVAFYNRSGANGQTSSGTLLFTDTGIANKEYNVGVNCGVAFSVGTFTSGTARGY